MIKAFVPWINKTDRVVLVGNSKRLGCWNPASGITMKKTAQFIYSGYINIEDDEQWKLTVIDSKNNITWEEGENRYASPSETIWFRGGRKATGIVTPLFSLRSNLDNGIGDFLSLELFIKKINIEGYRILQLLPLNDTLNDPNPYNFISAFAINPLYISLEKMGCLEDVEIAHSIADRTDQINYSPYVEWDDVTSIKWDYFRAIYAQDGEKIINSKEFIKFIEQEKFWIIPYALFRHLSEKKSTTDYSTWGENLVFSETLTKNLLNDPDSKGNIYFYIYLQFHAYKQLRNVRELARNKGVLLQCELPFTVQKYSADCWQFPNLLNTDVSAGTEPDSVCITGHKLNMGSYNPVKKENTWLIRRLQNLDRFYDICKINNISEYFRTWEIKNQFSTAIRGYYSPSLPFTKKEIENYGFNLDETRDTHPYLTKEYILHIFGDDFKRFGEFFKKKSEDGLYSFKKDMTEASNILAYFKDRKEEEQHIKEGLILLQDECLFVKVGDRYSPRIAAQYTNGYTVLTNFQKEIFNRIYDDFYYRRNDKLWEKTGIKRLTTIIANSKMMFCSDNTEKLPNYAFDVIKHMGIIPVEVELLSAFAPNRYPYMSIATTSDIANMLPVREWLEEKGYDGDSCHDIINRTINRTSAIAMITIQDYLTMSKDYVLEKDYNGNKISGRINGNWNWRVSPSY